MSERLAFDPGIFERQKRVLADAFSPNLAVESLHETVVGRLPWPRDVELTPR
jgi:hypothetical protein